MRKKKLLKLVLFRREEMFLSSPARLPGRVLLQAFIDNPTCTSERAAGEFVPLHAPSSSSSFFSYLKNKENLLLCAFLFVFFFFFLDGVKYYNDQGVVPVDTYNWARAE